MKFEPEKNRKPQHILYVWNYPDWGGAQIYFLALMKEAKKYADIRAVLPAGSNSQLLRFLDEQKIPCDFINTQTDNREAATFQRKIERHFRKIRSEYFFCRHLRQNYDLKNSVVHAEFAPWQSFTALWWLSRKTKVFTTVHNSVAPNKFRRLLWKIKLKILTKSKNFRIFTANEDAKKWLREYVSEDFYDSIRVTYASINPKEIAESLAGEINGAEICRRYGIPPEKFKVFCVGQFIDRKGRWIFLEAAREILKKDSETVFVWISNSKPSSEDWQKAESFGLGKNFVFISSDQIGKSRRDLFQLIAQADVFALPSFVEGLPISILEAATIGKPVISTNINGIPEAVKHLETGYLIEPNNVAQLVKAIETLKSDENLRKKLGENGKKFVTEKFDERNTAQVALETYLKAFSE